MEQNEYQKMFEFENEYWWYRGLHELVCANVAELKTIKSNEKLNIFDAGCGTGRLMELLRRYGNVEGIDYSEQAILLCRQRGLKKVNQEDLNKWEPPIEQYDVIVSNDVICTSGVTNDMEVVAKFHKGLKPNGTLILNLPAFMALRRRHDIAVSGKRRYRKKQTLMQLKKIGFSSIKATYRLPPLFFLMLAQKHLWERFDSGKIESDLKPLPSILNIFFLWMNRFENKIIKWGMVLPFGSSLFLICKKKQ